MPPLLSSPSEKGGLVLRYFPSRIEGVVGFPPLSEKEGWLSFRDGVNGVRRLPPLSHRRDVSSPSSLVGEALLLYLLACREGDVWRSSSLSEKGPVTSTSEKEE